MKLATPEDFSPLQHPLDMLEQAVEDNGWPFERSARDEINLSVAGRWCDYHFCFTWREDLQALHVSVSFDMRVSRERRSEIAELLMSINAQLWLGHFDLWSEDGTVLFRHVLIFPDSRVSAAQCEALLGSHGGRRAGMRGPGLVSRFRSSLDHRYRTPGELRNRNDTRIQ